MNAYISFAHTRKIRIALLVASLLTFAWVGSALARDMPFAGGAGTVEDPYQIETAEQLDQIRNYLNGHFVLIADIDLTAYEQWKPIGTFASRSDAPEDAEVPKEELAFRGTFDGAGHKISNLTVEEPQSLAVGLFGCVMGTEQYPCAIGNLTLENVKVAGYYLVGGLVGLQYTGCEVHDIALTGNNRIQGLQGVGGIVGTAFDAIERCVATAEIRLVGDDGACGGMIAGGTTGGLIRSCTARDGSVSAEGNACWGIGGLCGAPYAASEMTDCNVRNVTITASGEQNFLIGGLAGFAGTYQEETVAQITNCTVEDVRIAVSDDTICVGGIVGGSIADSESGRQGYFSLDNCSVSGEITGGAAYIGAAVGNPEGAQNVDCIGTMSEEIHTIGSADR